MICTCFVPVAFITGVFYAFMTQSTIFAIYGGTPITFVTIIIKARVLNAFFLFNFFIIDTRLPRIVIAAHAHVNFATITNTRNLIVIFARLSFFARIEAARVIDTSVVLLCLIINAHLMIFTLLALVNFAYWDWLHFIRKGPITHFCAFARTVIMAWIIYTLVKKTKLVIATDATHVFLAQGHR
jgi:hypothetical protein